MERDGVLEVSQDASDADPARKLYSITPEGRRCLARWQASLAAHHEHLGRVRHFIHSIRETAMNDTRECPPGDAAFLEEVRRRALDGKLPRREDIIRLLAYVPDSPQAARLGEMARDMAREVAARPGYGRPSAWTAAPAP